MSKNIPTTISGRKAKYTAAYYRKYKEDNKLRWADVPFVCHQCGNVFHLKKIKPHAFPVNCSATCRMLAFDPSISNGETAKIKALDWGLAKEMVIRGETGPKIAKKLGASLSSIHKHLKKKHGVDIYNKLIENGKKARKRAVLEAMSKGS